MAHISIKNVGVDYRTGGRGLSSLFRPSPSFSALKDVNLEIKDGERVGIIGKNGAGKSTLLKTIAGIYPPSHGQITVEGSLVPLLELGAGFDKRRTVQENIYLNAALLGMSRSEAKGIVDEVLEFSGMESFAHFTLGQLSSGMRSRIGFSIATSIHPEIIILDEVFAAGDAFFIERARERMNSVIGKCDIMLLVSHRIALIKEMCSRAVLIESGRVVMDGPVDEVIAHYESQVLENSSGGKIEGERTRLLQGKNDD